MKKIILALFTFLALQTTFAQEKKAKNSSDDKIEAHVNRLTLDLDLNQEQQNKVKSLFEKQINSRIDAQEKPKKDKETVQMVHSVKKEDRLKSRSKTLDHQTIFTKKMKEILTPEQFKKWRSQATKKKQKH